MTSVAPVSPQVRGNKRGRRDEVDFFYNPHGKKHRTQLFAEPSGSPHRSLSVLHRLLSVFKDMDEQVITNVLESCHGDLNEALEKLNQLSLATSAAACGELSGASSPTRQAHSNGAPSPIQVPASPTATPPVEPDDISRWSEALCNEMAAATSVADAKQRAMKFLASMSEHLESKAAEKFAASKEQTLRENAILKRAVAIQHTRMKDATEKDQQLQQLRQMLGQYEERCRTLEAANYSLNLHLKAATSAQSVLGGRPPDVF